MSLVSNKVETNTYELVVSIGAEDFKKESTKFIRKPRKILRFPVFAREKRPKA